ncbi:hypothetical protein HY631_01770 [Candidatus Uhrbacteria bacterium]|nr:hypothetical protein [Candidatus Uhrbacteria bacterium]
MQTNDIRLLQASAWWSGDLMHALGINTFADYLATIPMIPEHLLKGHEGLLLLSLVEVRGGLAMRCRLARIRFAELNYDETTFVPWDERHASPTAPFWVRHDDGRANLGRSPPLCREECPDALLAGTPDIGVAALLHHGISNVDLPGYVCRSHRAICARLGFGPPHVLDAFGSARPWPDHGTLIACR